MLPIISGFPGISTTTTSFPSVLGSASNILNGTVNNFPCDLPASIQEGETLLLFVTHGCNVSRTVSTPSGWTLLYSDTGPSNLRRTACFYKTATGSEGSYVTVTFSGSGGLSYSYIGSSLRVTPSIIEAGSSTTGTSTSPNSSSLTPSTGSSSYLWLTAMHTIFSGRASYSYTAPTNYTKIVEEPFFGGYTYFGSQVVSSRELTAASEDPGAGTINSSSPWVARTISLRTT